MDCRICDAKNSFALFEESLDKFNIASAVLICKNCYVLYNPKLDLQQIDKLSFEKTQGEAVQIHYKVVEDMEAERQFVIGKTPVITFLLDNFPDLKKKVLVDIGTGSGHLALAATPYFEHVYATDLDTTQVEKIVRQYGKKNISVVANFETIQQEFDVAILWHTMEHLFDPRQLLGNLKKKMSDGGLIYCQVPMFKKPAFEDCHVWFYNALTIERICEMYGFSGHRVYFDHTNNFMTFILIK
jgi:2-polyprenyl-3-methyl-5-hydroxy-6-metoxy-1,4-benzoquinol methylase